MINIHLDDVYLSGIQENQWIEISDVTSSCHPFEVKDPCITSSQQSAQSHLPKFLYVVADRLTDKQNWVFFLTFLELVRLT